MTTFLQVCAGCIGLVLLYYGAEFLVKGSVAVATRMKISTLVIGLTLVAFGTSAPELVVSVDAALNGHGDVSIGNIVGSNICNIALILGLCSMITPLNVNKKLFRLDVPLMIAASILLTGFYAMSGGIERWQGAILFAGVIAYTVWSLYDARKETPVQERELPAEAETPAEKLLPVPLALLFAVIGLAALIGGGKLLVNSAVYIAKLFSVPEAVIGLTVVAVGTSLPELVTSVVAALHGEKDIAIGNVVGSNIFNILAILGITPLIAPIYAPGISYIDMALMVGLSVLLYPFMKTGYRVSRREGLCLFLVYVGYTVWLILN